MTATTVHMEMQARQWTCPYRPRQSIAMVDPAHAIKVSARNVDVFYGEKHAIKDVVRRHPGPLRDVVHRTVRLRQVDVPALHQPHERHHPDLPGHRQDHDRGSGHLRSCARCRPAPRPRRHGLPEAQSVPEVDLRERRLRPAHPRPRQIQGGTGRDRDDQPARRRGSSRRSRTGSTIPAPACRAASSSAFASRARSPSAPTSF